MKPLRKAASPELIQSVIVAYANFQSLSLLTSGAHWNVTGADFYQLHLLFQRQYEEISEAVDRIAEHIRYLGGRVPFSLADLAMLSQIPFPPATAKPAELTLAAIRGNEALEISLTGAIALTSNDGTNNLLADELEKVGGRLYLLRSLFGD